MSEDPRLVIFARFWNDADWLEAALEHIEAWRPDAVVFSEGCWDPKRPARSTDGTRERLERYASELPETHLIDNLRDDDYRVNQANTCNKAMQVADVKPNDYVMVVDCDFYYNQEMINLTQSSMKNEQYDYASIVQMNFWDSTELYYPRITKTSPQIPQRVFPGARWVPTCHLIVDGCAVAHMKGAKCSSVMPLQFHYEGMREKQRLKDKYGVADRQSPVEWNNGVKLKVRKHYVGAHPEWAVPVLEKKGYEL